MNERIGVVPAPLEVETKARVWRRVRCRSQKGRGKRIETGILEGQPREGFNAASLVNGAPFYYAPPFDDSYFVLIVPPSSIWQPFIPPLSLSSRTNKSKHYRPCREYLLREDEYTSGLWLKRWKRFSFGLNLFEEGLLWEIWIYFFYINMI